VRTQIIVFKSEKFIATSQPTLIQLLIYRFVSYLHFVPTV